MGAICTVILFLLGLVLVLTFLHHAPVLVLCMNCTAPQTAPAVVNVYQSVLPATVVPVAATTPVARCTEEEFNTPVTVAIPSKEEFGDAVAVSIPQR